MRAARPSAASSSSASGLPPVAAWSRSAVSGVKPWQQLGRLHVAQAGYPERRHVGVGEERRLALALGDERPRPDRRAGGETRTAAPGHWARPATARHRSASPPAPLGVRGQQAERRGADREPILCRPGPERERRLERDRLGLRHRVEQRQRGAGSARTARRTGSPPRTRSPVPGAAAWVGGRARRRGRAGPSCRSPARRPTPASCSRPTAPAPARLDLATLRLADPAA